MNKIEYIKYYSKKYGMIFEGFSDYNKLEIRMAELRALGFDVLAGPTTLVK